MSIPELITPTNQIQFVISSDGKPVAVQMDIATWRRIVAALEDTEDRSLAQHALATLDAVGGDFDKAGYLDWDDVRAELEAQDAQEHVTS